MRDAVTIVSGDSVLEAERWASGWLGAAWSTAGLGEREPEKMVLGWRDVVQGPFEVRRKDGLVLVVEGLVDDLTYRVRSNIGSAVLRQMPRRSFIIARLVAVGDEWMLSGPVQVLRASGTSPVSSRWTCRCVRRRRCSGIRRSWLRRGTISVLIGHGSSSSPVGLLKRPRFDWNRDGEGLLREFKSGYFDRPPRPRVSPLSERLAEFARSR